MTDADFWTLVAMVPPHELADDPGAVADAEDLAALTSELAARPDEQVISFFHLFSAKLHALDTPAHYENCRVCGHEASSDVFLYARCHVLALGPDRYAEILSDPTRFPRDLWFEDILGSANEAYDRVWERDPDPDARPNYESFTNVAWNTK